MANKMRILFVDDEVGVLDGLRRMLRKHSQWELDCACSGEEALGKMSVTPFDVIVTDMQMPGMNGAELLELVIELHPETARIVLSGQCNEDLAIRALRVAHQYLDKPANAETLKLAITKACPLQSLINNERVRSAVTSCEGLPAMPALCAELTRVMELQRTDAKQVAKVISRDPGMAAKILQLVNSSFFGVGRRVSGIQQAVTLLGLLRIRGLVLREHLFQALTLPRPVRYFSIERLWHRSLMVAALARRISEHERQTDDRPDQAFTSGLLHDAGTLVLASKRHADYEKALDLCYEEHIPVCQAEMQVLGVTHAEIGAYLLRLWGLPARIVEAVAFHHNPSGVIYNGLCAVSVIHAADALLGEIDCDDPFEPPIGCDPQLPRLDEEYFARTGLAENLKTWRGLARDTIVRFMECKL